MSSENLKTNQHVESDPLFEDSDHQLSLFWIGIALFTVQFAWLP